MKETEASGGWYIPCVNEHVLYLYAVVFDLLIAVQKEDI